MDFPESKYHAGNIIPSEYWACVQDAQWEEDTSDNPTVVIPRPKVEPPPIEDRWFYPF